MKPNVRVLVVLTVCTIIFPVCVATEAFSQGFGPWGGGSDQPTFQAFGGSGTDMAPWSSANTPSVETGPWSASAGWSAGRSLYENFLLENPDSSLSGPTVFDSEGDGSSGIFDDWGLGGPGTFWGFAPIGGTASASQGDLIVPPVW